MNASAFKPPEATSTTRVLLLVVENSLKDSEWSGVSAQATASTEH